MTSVCWTFLQTFQTNFRRFPVDLNADRSMDEAQDIIIVNKEGVLTNLTALSPTRCISAIN